MGITFPKSTGNGKVGPDDWGRAELRAKHGMWIWELPDSPDSSEYALSSNESDEDDFAYGAFH